MTIDSLVGALVLAAVHLAGGALRFLDVIPRSRWLSFGSGISVAYVFLHLLPEVAAVELRAPIEVDGGPGWVLALAGLVVFYALERAAQRSHGGRRHGSVTADPVGWLHIASYTVYNGIVGYVVHEQADRGTHALVLYVVALGVHFVVNDHGLRADHGDVYDRYGRWLVSAGVLLGWAGARTFDGSEGSVGVLMALLAGGVVLNVLKEELPEEREARLAPFVAGVVGYGALLLA